MADRAAADATGAGAAVTPQAFQAQVRPHIAAVRRFARSLSHDWQDADDIAQEALLKAYRSISTFRGDASFLTWLLTVTRTVAADWHGGRMLRARRSEVELDEEAQVEERSQERLLLEKARAEQLWKHLEELDEKYRVPLVLADLEELSYEEIARLEGVPLGTVRTRLHRARAQLRTKLQKAAARSDRPEGDDG